MRGCHRPPLELIRLMAKTGFITEDLWLRYFFSARSLSWARRVRNDYIRRGYFRVHPNKYYQNVYILNPASEVVRALRIDPVSAPPITQIEHDELLLAGVLNLERSGLMSFWQTEGELKKLGASDYRIETQGQLIKYPDLLAYTRAPLPERILAIEMERTLKTRTRYIQLLGAYASMKRINGLIYIVENPSIERTIREVMEETYFPSDRLPVAFFHQDDWLKDAPTVLRKAAAMTDTTLKSAS